jgi:hypothetical protein
MNIFLLFWGHQRTPVLAITTLVAHDYPMGRLSGPLTARLYGNVQGNGHFGAPRLQSVFSGLPGNSHLLSVSADTFILFPAD